MPSRPAALNATLWRALWLPAASSVAAAVAVTYAVLATSPTLQVAPIVTPERAAEEFMDAYQNRNWEAAARLATGELRRSVETRARTARLSGREAAKGRRRLEIEESFLLEVDRLRFAGVLVPEHGPQDRGWPVSITVALHGDRYLAEALTWPKGAPVADDRL